MANRFPLVLSSNEIRELPSTDDLDLTGSSIVGADHISATSITVNGGSLGAAVSYADIPNAPTQLSDLTNDIGLTISRDFNDITSKPTTLAGYGITDAATLVQGQRADSAIQPGGNISSLNNDANFITLADVTGEITVNSTGDLQGSVFADNSTLLVDGVNGNVPSSVVAGTEATNWDTAYSWGDHSVVGYLTSVAFADLTSTPTTVAGYGITDAFDGTFASLTGKPSTLAGYGITAALTDIGIIEGVDGQFLMTDGAGSFTFETVSGGGGAVPLQAVTTEGAVTTDQVTFSGGIIVDAMQPSVGVGPTVHTGNFDITGTLSVTADVDVPNGTVTASSFATSGVGTPTLESATNLDLEAANNIVLKINTATVATISSTGIAANLTGNVTGNVTGTLDGEVTGSVFADDSTLLVDGVNATIPWSVISGQGNEAYDNFGTSTSYNPGGAIAHGSYFRNEADTADVAANVTVTPGFSKIKVELDASIANVTDATTEMVIALERTVDGLNPTTVKTFLFPVANTFYGSQHFLYIDTHGASAGSTVEYKLKVDMSAYSNESARGQYGICGDTLYIKEIA